MQLGIPKILRADSASEAGDLQIPSFYLDEMAHSLHKEVYWSTFCYSTATRRRTRSGPPWLRRQRLRAPPTSTCKAPASTCRQSRLTARTATPVFPTLRETSPPLSLIKTHCRGRENYQRRTTGMLLRRRETNYQKQQICFPRWYPPLLPPPPLHPMQY